MIAFFLAIGHIEVDTLWTYLCNYTPDPKLLILAAEISHVSHADTSGQHFHVVADWEDKTWETFKKTILIKKYNLRGQAKDGLPRQYGRVTKIKDKDKMIAYTIKGGQFRYKNVDDKYIEQCLEMSFEKEEDKKEAYQETLMVHLLAVRETFMNLNNDPNRYDSLCDNPINVYYLAEEILMHHMENKDKPICRTKLEYYIEYYLQCEEPLRFNKKVRQQILSIILKRI